MVHLITRNYAPLASGLTWFFNCKATYKSWFINHSRIASCFANCQTLHSTPQDASSLIILLYTCTNIHKTSFKLLAYLYFRSFYADFKWIVCVADNNPLVIGLLLCFTYIEERLFSCWFLRKTNHQTTYIMVCYKDTYFSLTNDLNLIFVCEWHLP